MQKKTPLEYSIKLQEVSLYEERMLLKSDNKPINPIKSEQNYSKKSKCLKNASRFVVYTRFHPIFPQEFWRE